MKAWKFITEMTENAVPVVLAQEEQGWESLNDNENSIDAYLKLMWSSHVPGSAAPESVIIAGIQSAEQLGLDVSEAEELIPSGLQALKDNDMMSLQRISGQIQNALNRAPKNPSSEYWKFRQYETFEEYESNVHFPSPVKIDLQSEDFNDKICAGWLGRLIGGAFGTEIEGYTTENLRAKFGKLDHFIRKPNTYNDDITYEIALLKTVLEKKGMPSAQDIALNWLALVPSGWSAEQMALDNLKKGLFPPQSAYFCNPYREWIGAQMRGAICGQLCPGNARLAARLAWNDASISHTTNGILGEVFNAVLVSLSFAGNDMRSVLKQTAGLIPSDSEYYSVIRFALEQCKCSSYEEARKACQQKYREYNWIHAYPNAAAQVVALWYGNGDFSRTLELIGDYGQDVDCNAAQMAVAVGTMKGSAAIDSRWSSPFDDEIITYLRGNKKMSLSRLCRETCMAAGSLS
ncbi:MAG: ADP-ribosylglycohydrolase family protein [Candidatus Cloacimonetes bacterium]|nr:ADP-ribosylglycohydrolase family protein [Candidatus Cloacimonadota bacterium]